MNYYPFHIGDFRSGTANMSRLQRAIYRDLLDICYDTEKPLPLDMEELHYAVGAQSEEERHIVEQVLRFKFVKQDDGYHHEICEKVIAEYHAKAEVAKANGKLGGRPAKAKANPKEPSGLSVGTGSEPDRNRIGTGSQANQEPITINHKPPKSKAEASPPALPDWLPLEAWTGYLEMRKKIKKPPTDRAIGILLTSLDALRTSGQDIAAVLDKSTMSNWVDVYAIRDDRRSAAGPPAAPVKFDPVAYVNRNRIPP